MKETIQVLLEFFFGELSLKKIWLLLVSVFIVIALLMLYERITASMRINRLEKEAGLLSKLQEVQKLGTNTPPQITQAELALYAQAAQLIKEEQLGFNFISPKLNFSFDSLLKCFWGGVFWLMVAIYLLSKQKTKEDKYSVRLFFVLAVICGIVGLFVPPIWWPWFHIFILPWLFLVVASIVLLPLVILVANFYAARKTALTNACINNLRQIDAAKIQWALENSKPVEAIPTKEDLTSYLPDSVFPECPCGGAYTLNTVGSKPVCSEKNHDLLP